jgi:aspartate aminotransferase
VRVLDFTVGEPDQPTPRHILEAGKAALEAGKTKYPPASGEGELRAAVARRYREDFDFAFAPENVVATVGGKQGLAVLCQAVLDAGSEMVIPTPAWPTFGEAVRVAGGRPVFLPLSEQGGFRLTARAVARVVGPRTRVVLVNTPSNPTGAVVDPPELLAIARLARRRGFLLVYDDTYAHLVYPPRVPASLREVSEVAGDRLVVLGTASKTYCMTGWRVGWIVGPRPLVDAVTALNSHSVQGPATFAQLAAAAALNGPQDVVRLLVEEYDRRRAFIHRAIAAVPGISCLVPEGAFYLFPNAARHLTRAVPDTVALATRLLEETAVAVVPGDAFGAPGYFRLSFATSMADLEEGARRIAEAFAAGSRR